MAKKVPVLNAVVETVAQPAVDVAKIDSRAGVEKNKDIIDAHKEIRMHEITSQKELCRHAVDILGKQYRYAKNDRQKEHLDNSITKIVTSGTNNFGNEKVVYDAD